MWTLVPMLVYMLFLFVICGWLLFVMPAWWFKGLLILDMVLIVHLVKYLKRLFSSLA